MQRPRLSPVPTIPRKLNGTPQSLPPIFHPDPAPMASRKLFSRLFVAVVVFGLALAVAADVPTQDGTGSDSGYPGNDVNSQNGAAEANDGRFATRWSTRGGGAGGF